MPPRKKAAPMSPPNSVKGKAVKAAKAKAKPQPKVTEVAEAEDVNVNDPSSPMYSLEVRDKDGNIVTGPIRKRKASGRSEKLPQLSPGTVGKYQKQWQNFGVGVSSSGSKDVVSGAVETSQPEAPSASAKPTETVNELQVEQPLEPEKATLPTAAEPPTEAKAVEQDGAEHVPEAQAQTMLDVATAPAASEIATAATAPTEKTETAPAAETSTPHDAEDHKNETCTWIEFL